MKIYKIIIKLESSFITPFKGDSLFGSIIWYLNDLGKIDLDKLFSNYNKHPFLIVSSAFPCIKQNQEWTFLLKKPAIPTSLLLPDIEPEKRKQIKTKVWFPFKTEQNIGIQSIDDFKNDEEIIAKFSINTSEKTIFYKQKEYHNSIHRIKNTTLSENIEEGFAPFQYLVTYLPEEVYLYFYVAVDDTLNFHNQIFPAIQYLGKFGFGKKASSGKGKFSIVEIIENIEFPINQKSYYTLAPMIASENDKQNIEEYYYESFTRFGKNYNSTNYIKEPILFMDEGSILIMKNQNSGQYFVGQGIQIKEKKYIQGYSLILPIQFQAGTIL